MMKVGISTGGGDCPGLNATIRALVKYGMIKYNMEMYGIYDSFDGLQETPMRVKKFTFEDVAEIQNRGGTILGTVNRGNSFVTEKGKKDLAKTVAGIKELGLDTVVVIGGEGTQTMSQQLIEAGAPIIGIPKTIDNDLPETDQTIGFSTCVDFIADSLIRLRSTAESHDRIMILEVMGRDSGYTALYGGIAGGANAILIPEIPFDYDVICKKIEHRKTLGRNFSLILVSEGAFEKGTDMTYKTSPTGAKNLGGIGQSIAKNLFERTGMDTRVTILGHLQRGGSPNATDKLLAARFASHAIELAAQKKNNRMVVLQNNKILDIPFSKIGKYERRKIPLDHELIKSAYNTGICMGAKLDC